MQNVASKATAKAPSKATTPTWLPNAAVVAVGGMLFTALAQWVIQLWAVQWEEGHLIDPDIKTTIFFPTLFICAFAYMMFKGGFGLGVQKSVGNTYRSGGDATSTLVIIAIFFLLILFFVPCDVSIAISTMGLCGLGMLGISALYFVYQEPKARTYTVLTWVLGYLALWVVSATLSSVSIWIFLVGWILFGALGGNTVTTVLRKAADQSHRDSGHTWRTREVSKEQVQRSRRARMTSAVVSQFGRIPQDTFDLFNQHVRRVTGAIAASIPLDASEAIRNLTIREILDITLRDWRENDNLQGLQPKDVDDLRSFIEVAASVAGRGHDPTSLAIYKITLRALLQDWLDNWNVDGQPGPPIRKY